MLCDEFANAEMEKMMFRAVKSDCGQNHCHVALRTSCLGILEHRQRCSTSLRLSFASASDFMAFL
jgi:hypothetical protein